MSISMKAPSGKKEPSAGESFGSLKTLVELYLLSARYCAGHCGMNTVPVPRELLEYLILTFLHTSEAWSGYCIPFHHILCVLGQGRGR